MIGSNYVVDAIQLQKYIGHGNFAMNEVKINRNTTMGNYVAPKIPKGTFLRFLNMHANNFQILADFLLPIFCLWRKTKDSWGSDS